MIKGKLFDRARLKFWVMAATLLLLGIGALDYVSGSEISFSVFYMLPIFLFAWLTDEKVGTALSFISAAIWLLADIFAGSYYSSPLIYVWNSIVRLIFFLLVVLLARIGKDLERERLHSRFDFLTGAINTRFFYHRAQTKIDRCARYEHPLSIVYLDIDNFKSINDQFGHSVGDAVLTSVVTCIQMQLRKTDFVARVGGDEFVVLLPELNAVNARTVVPKIQQALAREMRQGPWDVTFSMGALTFETPPASVDEMLAMADQAMYSIKSSGKDNISYSIQSSRNG